MGPLTQHDACQDGVAGITRATGAVRRALENILQPVETCLVTADWRSLSDQQAGRGYGRPGSPTMLVAPS